MNSVILDDSNVTQICNKGRLDLNISDRVQKEDVYLHPDL